MDQRILAIELFKYIKREKFLFDCNTLGGIFALFIKKTGNGTGKM